MADFVKEEFDAFLECGVLAHGFLRLRCADCAHEKLVAFSCKRRGFCPACGARQKLSPTWSITSSPELDSSRAQQYPAFDTVQHRGRRITGIRSVILPRRNERDLEEVPEELRRQLRFLLFVDDAEEVLRHALTPSPADVPRHAS